MSNHKIVGDDGTLTDRETTPRNLKIGDRVTHTEERPNQIATILRGAGERVVIRWEDGHTYGALPKNLRTVTVDRHQFKVGDRVEQVDTEPGYVGTVSHVYNDGAERAMVDWDKGPSHEVTAKYLKHSNVNTKPATYALDDVMNAFGVTREELEDDTGEPANPYYTFPGGHETRHISAHLTSFGGQALQYIARATRLDGNNKHDPIECLEKAGHLIQWEIQRLKDQP